MNYRRWSSAVLIAGTVAVLALKIARNRQRHQLIGISGTLSGQAGRLECWTGKPCVMKR